MRVSINTFVILVIILFISSSTVIAQKTVSSDKKWTSKAEFIKDGYEAEYIIRLGDVDNLGFGWPEGYDPFCGKMTDAHYFPWPPDKSDVPFMDRIIVSSKYNPQKDQPCGQDGYSFSSNDYTKGPAIFKIPVQQVKSVVIKDAWLQLFIDDFQAKTFCSYFRVKINDQVFTEAEKILNAIDQTGPVGKLVTIRIPEEFYPIINSSQDINLTIDETKGAGDGYAIDFIRILINRRRDNSCKGTIRGIVLDKETYDVIPGARVKINEELNAIANEEGRFEFRDVATGFEVLTASAVGYSDGFATADIGEGDENDEVVILMETGREKARYDNTSINVGESIRLNNILFDQGKAILRPESLLELDKIYNFLVQYPNAEIELSGHTSSEGAYDFNRSLSYQRVNACKQYITGKGIDPSRVVAIGLGPDRPVASNDTETNRALNRRVEMRLVKI